MTETEIAEALERFIVEGLPERRVLLENVDGVLELPYLTVEISPVSRTNPTVDATESATVSRGKVYMAVISEAGKFAKPARIIADEVLALLPYGLRIPLTSGNILVRKPPDVLQGYRDGPNWRLPIEIDYEVEL